MQGTYKTFIFEDYHFDAVAKTLALKYSFDGKVKFAETFRFDFDFVEHRDEEVLEKAFFGLFIMAGISYYKAALPEKIVLKKGSLDPMQKDFFEKTYVHGLGEFYYQNDVKPPMEIGFPCEADEAGPPQLQISSFTGSLVLLGGGKDSLVTAEALKAGSEDFETFTMNTDERFAPMIKKIGVEHLNVRRTIAPELLKLNEEGALNGHVPISSILAFLATVVAVLRGRQNVLVSNERSANEANTTYRGLEVNHQYSKSLAFEEDFQNYLHEYISPSLSYFSFLRPLSELRIAQIFCSKIFPQYKGCFTSCNKNFRLEHAAPKFTWCGACPKCVFVFLLFAPFLRREDLLALFGGKNLLEDPELKGTFQELLGLSGIKPFECVGEVEEVRKGVLMARETGGWPELTKYDFQPPGEGWKTFGEHRMGEKFETLLKDYLA